jgi:tRNA pseudouridine38-40 synthase
MRVALVIEYNGCGFHGWQTQHGLRTVQAELERALTHIAAHPVKVVAAGRTDAGVHASHQVVHFDTCAQRSTRDWVVGGNHYLPKDIAIRSAHFVPEDFHARFSAVARCYEYWIDTHCARPALRHKQVTWIPRRLNIEAMHEAAQQLVGAHDFSAFRARDCQAKNPLRTVTHITLKKSDQLIVLTISANAFLHHMVRNIVGSLVPIGCGLAPKESLLHMLHSKDRAQAGMTAPADGLYLSGVQYPDIFQKFLL